LSLYRTRRDAFNPRDLKWLISLAGTLAEALSVRQAPAQALILKNSEGKPETRRLVKGERGVRFPIT